MRLLQPYYYRDGARQYATDTANIRRRQKCRKSTITRAFYTPHWPRHKPSIKPLPRMRVSSGYVVRVAQEVSRYDMRTRTAAEWAEVG
jgi:hypothetical protein